MCLFIYTLPQLCGHTHFQNVAECPVARGVTLVEPRPGNRSSVTLDAPKFLFDTAHDRSHTPEFYSRNFDCKKRRAIRPVMAFCEGCLAAAEGRVVMVEEEEEEDDAAVSAMDHEGVVVADPAGVSSSGSSGSSGSSDALVAASTSVSDVGISGTSTPQSLWNLARPSEIV